MTNNPTIDGVLVPRELLVAMRKTCKLSVREWGELDSAMEAPALAAVVLPERMPGIVDTDSHQEGWNACLDTTAALNTPK